MRFSDKKGYYQNETKSERMEKNYTPPNIGEHRRKKKSKNEVFEKK